MKKDKIDVSKEKPKCKSCGRPIRAKLSIERGYGIGCYNKLFPPKKKKKPEGYFK